MGQNRSGLKLVLLNSHVQQRKGLFHQEGAGEAIEHLNSHNCSATVTDVPCFLGPSYCIMSPSLRSGSSDLHFQRLSQQQTPAAQDAPPAAPKSQALGSQEKHCPKPQHFSSPPVSYRGLQEQTALPILTAASTQLFTPVLSQQRLAKPSPRLCTPVSCCRAKRRRRHGRGHTATDTITQQGFRVPHVILARHCLPLEIGTLPNAPGQVPGCKTRWEPVARAPAALQLWLPTRRRDRLLPPALPMPKHQRW